MAACLPTRPEGSNQVDLGQGGAGASSEGAGGSSIVITDPTGTGGTGTTPVDPHAITGADPPHGRFAGGVRVLIQGSGFAGQLRVWFGDSEVPASDVVPISERKVQVTAPPGQPGLVDVTVQNGDDASTRRTLPGGFTYDPFYAEPDSGPTSGGTVVTLVGAKTAWASGVTVRIGDNPCQPVAVAGATSLTCTAAAAPAGVRSVTVTSPDTGAVVVPDAFTYADSDNGYRGGLSGSPLPLPPAPGQPATGKLRVLAFDSSQGKPLTGASVFLGKTKVGTIGAEGVIDIEGVVAPAAGSAGGGPAGAAKLTVTVAHKCSQPQTFAGVSVDTVTMYLDPVKSPDCAPPEGDPPPTGGTPSLGTSVQGQVSFPSYIEKPQPPWSSVPAPTSADEHKVAYLFVASSDPRTQFRLPDAVQAVTEQNVLAGGKAFPFTLSTYLSGNITLYALAGIENRVKSPPVFTAYAMGVTQGVSTKPGQSTPDVGLVIDTTLDQAVTLDLSPPTAGPKGPDRLTASVAVSLGHGGYAILPGAQRTLPLPLGGPTSFVGLPPLTGPLKGLRYVASAVAGTGPQQTLPVSSLGLFSFTDPSKPLGLDGFVPLPVLTDPSKGAWDGSHLTIAPASGGVQPALLYIDAESANGLIGWTIAAPGGTTSIELPDLSAIPNGGLIPGPVTFTVSAATLDSFDYNQLRYRHLSSSAWLAYARDAFYAQLSP